MNLHLPEVMMSPDTAWENVWETIGQEKWLTLSDIWMKDPRGLLGTSFVCRLCLLIQNRAEIKWLSTGTTHKVAPQASGPLLRTRLIHGCKFQQVWSNRQRVTSPCDAGAPQGHDQSPTQTSRAHNHKSHPRKHTPTTSSHKKTSFSITEGKVTAQQISPFFLLRAAGH